VYKIFLTVSPDYVDGAVHQLVPYRTLEGGLVGLHSST
jgi:hypothetical protein